MKTLLFFMLIMKATLLCTFVKAQALRKGEHLPNYTFTINIGDSSFKADLNDYNDKFILLDFWSKDCLDCIASMPKLLSLQEKFKEKLTLLLVTKNTTEEIKTFFSKFRNKEKTNKWIESALKLPLILNDTFFTKLFPVNVLPTHVWIGKSLTHYGMAYSTSANSENIANWIKGKDIRLDELVAREIDPLDPLSILTASKDHLNKPISYSVLLPRIEFGMGAPGWITNITDSISGREIGITCLNSSIKELYKIAYRKSLKQGYIIPDYMIKWNTSKKIEVIAPPLYPPGSEKSIYFEWAQKNTFCYALKIAPSSIQDLYTVMQKDLDRYFGLKSSLVQMEVKCRILKTTASGAKKRLLLSKKGTPERYLDSEKELIIENFPMEQLYLGLKKIADDQKWTMPFINEVRLEGNINFKLRWDRDLSTISLRDLNIELEKYGLIITEENRRLKILTIAD